MTATWTSRCVLCGHTEPLDDHPDGCPRCRARDVGAPLLPERSGPAPGRPPPGGPAAGGLGAMWRWRERLVPVERPVSLGEGGSPLVPLGPDGRVLVKDERANPTGSFKDRLASAAISRAVHRGAATVALASSGNAAVAAAAYAAAAGLRCVCVVTADVPASALAAVADLGARVLVAGSPADRWTAVRTGARALGWTPLTNYRTPPVSSIGPGVHAYRTIAYEIAEQLGWRAPDRVVLPVSRGDGLYGIAAGFAELHREGLVDRVPRFVAVERMPSLTRALASGEDQPRAVDGSPGSSSIADRQGTAMALAALRATGGTAVAVDDDAMAGAARRLAARGLLAEPAAAAWLCGVDELDRRGELPAGSVVVAVLTARPNGTPATDRPDPVRLRDPADPGELDRAAGPPGQG